ncbi:MAG: hypothetical protein MK102_11480 [Fuerstiella sp.]|nr:hypothetical protein [Fuerstiella sp.]
MDFLGGAAAGEGRDAVDFLASPAGFFLETAFLVTVFFLAERLPAFFFCVALRDAAFFLAADCNAVFFVAAFFFTAFFFAMELRLSELTPKEKEQAP